MKISKLTIPCADDGLHEGRQEFGIILGMKIEGLDLTFWRK